MKKFFYNLECLFLNYIIAPMFTYAFINTAWAILITLLVISLIRK